MDEADIDRSPAGLSGRATETARSSPSGPASADPARVSESAKIDTPFFSSALIASLTACLARLRSWDEADSHDPLPE